MVYTRGGMGKVADVGLCWRFLEGIPGPSGPFHKIEGAV